MSMLYLRQPHFYQWRESCRDSQSEFIAHKSSDMMLNRFTERVELLDPVFGFRAQFAVYSDVEGALHCGRSAMFTPVNDGQIG